MNSDSNEEISQPTTITKKEKNPRRVEQGKKLAEWNKEKKRLLKETKQKIQEPKIQELKIQEPKIQEPEIQEPKIQESKIHQSTNYWVIGGTMVAWGIAISLIYFIQRGKPEIQTPTVEMPKQEKDDFFDMN
jgi:hypothetical protein